MFKYLIPKCFTQILDWSGDQDACYYNFKCAHPIGPFTAFNNMWSNIGYILLGGLFIIIVLFRSVKPVTMYIDRNIGIVCGHIGIYSTGIASTLSEGAKINNMLK